MLQLRQHNARVRLTDRVQELPHGTVARRTDEGGHHGCTPKVRWITNVLSLNFLQVEQCLPELVVRHGFRPDSTQSHCLAALFLGWFFRFSTPPRFPWCGICRRCSWFCCRCWIFLQCFWKQFRRGGGTKGGKGKGPQQTFLGQSIMGLGLNYLMGASL